MVSVLMSDIFFRINIIACLLRHSNRIAQGRLIVTQANDFSTKTARRERMSSEAHVIPSSYMIIMAVSVLFVAGCASVPPAPTANAMIESPKDWRAPSDGPGVTPGWTDASNDLQLSRFVEEALANNHDLAQQAARVEQAEQNLIVIGARRLPELDAAFSAARRGGPAASANTFSISLDVNWELDVWSKLKDAEKQANLELSAQQAALRRTRNVLVAQTANAWYDILAAKNLLTLYEQRSKNLRSNLEVIESGYDQGLNSALDVYLTRSMVDQSDALIVAQEQNLNEAEQALQLLLGRYPDGRTELTSDFPVLVESVPAGLPSELIARRADLEAAWLQLLAANAGVAVAHRQRFPSFALTASLGQSASEFSDLFDSNKQLWNLIGSVTQPIFNAGRLKAAEAKSLAEYHELEQAYLEAVFTGFSEVERALNREQSLRRQYESYRHSEKNAINAQTLSFEQYQRGLVSYVTFLEAQRNAFDAQTNVIQLGKQRLQNRIALYLALGGDYVSPN